MRRFHDDAGGEWTAALWCGSYGEVRIIFSRTGSTDVFTSALEAESLASGEILLLEIAEHDLRGRLAVAEPWP